MALELIDVCHVSDVVMKNALNVMAKAELNVQSVMVQVKSV